MERGPAASEFGPALGAPGGLPVPLAAAPGLADAEDVAVDKDEGEAEADGLGEADDAADEGVCVGAVDDVEGVCVAAVGDVAVSEVAAGPLPVTRSCSWPVPDDSGFPEIACTTKIAANAAKKVISVVITTIRTRSLPRGEDSAGAASTRAVLLVTPLG